MNNAFTSLERFQELMARLTTLKLPSMCVFNGTAIAGGYWLGLSHDFRIMNAEVGEICLSELKLGLTIPFPYARMLAAKLEPMIVTKISYSIDYKQEEALRDRLIDATYTGREDQEAKILAFAKRYAPLSLHRSAININKQN